jgi:hypothetical protein
MPCFQRLFLVLFSLFHPSATIAVIIVIRSLQVLLTCASLFPPLIFSFPNLLSQHKLKKVQLLFSYLHLIDLIDAFVLVLLIAFISFLKVPILFAAT